MFESPNIVMLDLFVAESQIETLSNVCVTRIDDMVTGASMSLIGNLKLQYDPGTIGAQVLTAPRPPTGVETAEETVKVMDNAFTRKPIVKRGRDDETTEFPAKR